MTITNRTFFSALGESGYVHGKTMQMAFRTAKEDRARMPSLVDDVPKNDVEILAVSSSPGYRARAHRFPIEMDTPCGYTDMGGVATEDVNIVPYCRRGAVEQTIPMLHGKRPGDLSWIGPKQVDVTVNEDVARLFGLIVPTVHT